MSWVIFLGDLGLIAYLTMKAYVDGMFCLPFAFYHIRLHMSRLVSGRDDLAMRQAREDTQGATTNAFLYAHCRYCG